MTVNIYVLNPWMKYPPGMYSALVAEELKKEKEQKEKVLATKNNKSGRGDAE